jgi:hypothetical protein
MTMPSRPTSSIVQAVLANLEMAALCANNREEKAKSEAMALAFCSEAGAYRQAIALIKTEFAEYLEATP